MIYATLTLIKGKEEALARRHPWIFSGALVPSSVKDIEIGMPVWIADTNGKILATGLYEQGSIAVKVLAFEKVELNRSFFEHRFMQAWALRRRLGLAHNSTTNAFRLVHSEGDQLPGLIVDIYDNTAVIQCHSKGMHRLRHWVAEAIIHTSEGRVKAVYDKSIDLLPSGFSEGDGFVVGLSQPGLIIENGHRFSVDWIGGQKTGYFLDQRDARQHLATLAAGRRVLNTFSYTGGFSVYALAGGATEVVSVDSSRKAIEGCVNNVALNGFDAHHTAVCADAKNYLASMPPNQFDIIVLDPPAFAKHHSQRHKGLLGYKYINRLAISKLATGGLLYTFSCSQAVDRQAFQSVVMAAAIEAGRPASVLHHFSQPSDHPVSLFHPEGAYLKGLLINVM